jgi:inner membrane protein
VFLTWEWHVRRSPLRSSLFALVAIAALDLSLVGRQPLVLHGAADELGHMMTALAWYGAMVTIGVPVLLMAMLIGAVMLDLDHVPLVFGWVSTPPGTSRPGTHSLLPVALMLWMALRDKDRRGWWTAAALGMVSHLWRDLGTGHVALLWPVSDRVATVPYAVYVMGLAAPVMVAGLWMTIREQPP